MAVCYLEVDDEITSAIGRIRAVRDGEVIIVVPPGSRIATSRINFKLLAREAAERKLNAVAVTDDPQARALAIAAGLPAYDSLGAAEQALASFREQDRQLAERLGRGGVAATAGRGAAAGAAGAASAAGGAAGAGGATGAPGATDVAGAKSASQQTMVLPLDFEGAPAARRAPAGTDTAVMPVDGVGQGGGALPATGAAAAATRRRKRRRLPLAPIAAFALLLLLVAGVAYGAYTFLPTASITLRPMTTQVSVPPFTVTADPNVAVVDAAAGVIPAEVVALPLHVEGTFSATGIEARETRATGVVRFRSENTLNAVPIPAQTVVSTSDGVEFVTQDAVTVPRASFETGPATVDVAVRAVRAGTRGNVAAGEVMHLPPAIATQLITVRNAEPMTGGRRVEEALVTQDDYDAAVASLGGQLDAALATALADPDSIPRGLVAFPSTAELGQAQPDQSAVALIDTVAPTFTLALDAQGQVIAVNEELIEEVAASRVAAQLPQGQALVDDQVSATSDAGTVVGSTIEYEVTADALALDQPSPQEIVEAVRGKSIAEARQALAQYGDADVTLWPDFIDRLPEQPARINVTFLPVGDGT